MAGEGEGEGEGGEEGKAGGGGSRPQVEWQGRQWVSRQRGQRTGQRPAQRERARLHRGQSGALTRTYVAGFMGLAQSLPATPCGAVQGGAGSWHCPRRLTKKKSTGTPGRRICVCEAIPLRLPLPCAPQTERRGVPGQLFHSPHTPPLKFTMPPRHPFVFLPFFLVLLLSPAGSLNLSAAAPSPQTAWASYHAAELARASGDPLTALLHYRDAALLRAGPGSGAALAALARLYEAGWDGGDGGASSAPRPAGAPPPSAPPVTSRLVQWLQAQALSWGRALSKALPLPLRPPPNVEQAAARRASSRSLLHRLAAQWARSGSGGGEGEGAASGAPSPPPPPPPPAAGAPAPAAASASPPAPPPLLIPQDFSVAVALWRAAAALGDPAGHFTMASLHSHGLFGAAPDPARVALHLHFAAAGRAGVAGGAVVQRAATVAAAAVAAAAPP